MSKLLTLLNTNFNSKEDLEVLMPSMVKLFNEGYGVNVKGEGEKVLLKYDMLDAKWTHPETHECRGCIVTREDGVWKYISRPYGKFFNVSEGHSGLHDDNTLKALLSKNSTRIVEKSDGSLIQVYCHGGDWQVSTSGMITPLNVQDYNFTFKDLFIRVLKDASLLRYLNRNYTYMFELCAAENRILTKYSTDRLYLLGARHTESGEYIDWAVMDNTANILGVHRPRVYLPSEVNVTDRDSLNIFVEAEKAKTDIYGEYPEGFILYDGLTPKGKIKNTQYLALHHMAGGDTKHTLNCLIEAYFVGGCDDMKPLLPISLLGYLERLEEWYKNEKRVINDALAKMAGKVYPTQKDFALEVKDLGGRHQSFFFANKEHLLMGQAVDLDLVPLYFSKSWSKFEKELKGL